jgi:hypothetical protein
MVRLIVDKLLRFSEMQDQEVAIRNYEDNWERVSQSWSADVDAIVGTTEVETRVDLPDGLDGDAFVYVARLESPYLEVLGIDRDKVLKILRDVVTGRENPVARAQAVPGIDKTIGGTVFLRTSRDVDGIWLYQIRGAIEFRSPFGYGSEVEAETAGLLVIEEKAKHQIKDMAALRGILKDVLTDEKYPWYSPPNPEMTQIDDLIDRLICEREGQQ